jgi:hypothetical protein
MFTRLSVLLSASSLMIALLFSAGVNAAPVYAQVGEATNDSAPSDWKGFEFDVTSLVSGATSASLKFDLRNDPSPFSANSTTSQVWFSSIGSDFSVKLNYASGADTSHWRNVQLLVDGKLYVDQFGSYNNHLGDPNYGTSWQGLWGSGNIAGDSGDGSTSFLLTADAAAAPISGVPVPAAVWLFGSALIGLLGSRKKALSPVIA